MKRTSFRSYRSFLFRLILLYISEKKLFGQVIDISEQMLKLLNVVPQLFEQWHDAFSLKKK